ncbi:VWA domain-containing protein [Thermostilla marina]
MEYAIAFDRPMWLWLLVLLPLLWWWSWRRLALLGRFRRGFAIFWRTLLFAVLAAALAEIQWVRTSDRLTVLYLLDQSASIPAEARQRMIDYVNADIAAHRAEDDRVGVIVFGRTAGIEAPPFDDDLRLPERIETPVDPEFTNLEAAMRLAEAAFPEDAARRIVIVTDGNENLGNAAEMGEHLADVPVGIDVVLVDTPPRADVMVQRIAVPAGLRRGRPFDLRVVLENNSPEGKSLPGRLIIRQRTEDEPLVLVDQHVDVAPGKQVFTIRRQFDDPGFYSFDAVFVPDDPESDALPQNNRATGFALVRGRGRILVIEDNVAVGRAARFVEAVRALNIEVVVRPAERAFTSAAELAGFDAVVLSDVPREALSDMQTTALVQNTQQGGSGLIMLGGPNSFGAGGWANTELEQAMPVDFQIDNLEVVPRGALAMVMHASEMANGNYWQVRIGQEAIRALGPRDYCGVIQYGARGTSWLWPGGMLEVGPRRRQMLALVGRMTPGDMPDFDPGLKLAAQGFAALPDAAVKHMIVISDGDPSPPTQAAINALVRQNVTVSTVAVGTHGPAGSRVLQRLAAQTGGKYYAVSNASALVRIYQRESRRVAMPLIYEQPAPFAVDRTGSHEILSGVRMPFCSISGYVMTRLKANPLVEAPLVASQPGNRENATILATWQYGLGRSAAFTTDIGTRWLDPNREWTEYDKFFGQLVTWAMRPTNDTGNYTVNTTIEGRTLHVTVDALDAENRYINFAEMVASVVAPDLEASTLVLKQTAPGRYEGEVPLGGAGDYLLTILPDTEAAPLIAGVTLPYSEEFRYRPANEPLLKHLAGMTPKGGSPGVLQRVDASFSILDDAATPPVDHYRRDLPKARSRQPAWHWLLLAAAWLLLADVFIRRVQLDPVAAVQRLVRLVRARFGGEEPAAEVVLLERLRSRKERVRRELQERAGERFEPGELPVEPADRPSPTAAPKPRPETEPEQAPSDEDTYTRRLLETKRRVWKRQSSAAPQEKPNENESNT